MYILNFKNTPDLNQNKIRLVLSDASGISMSSKSQGLSPSLQVSVSNAASTPTQAPAAGAAGVGVSSGSGQGDLDLFSDSSSTTKTDDTVKKPLSKDSILSLYGTNSMSQQAPAGEDPDVYSRHS